MALYYSARLPGQSGSHMYWTGRSERSTAWARPSLLELPKSDTSNEEAPSLSSDGKTLLFASDRPGGLGRSGSSCTDIWRSRREDVPSLAFGKPENLVLLNTEYDESFPRMTRDGSAIVFVRGLEIFLSPITTNSTLLNPLPLGLPAGWSVRSPQWLADGRTLYFTSDRPGGQGGWDVWQTRRVAKKNAGDPR
jgi:Tol biopolymer transport system component